MDAVAAADGDGVLVLEGALLQRRQKRVEIGEQDVAGARKLHGEAGVEHVGRGHALVDEARIRADEFGEMREEGDHVMLGDALDLVDAIDIELRRAALLPDRLRRFLRDHADLGKRVAGMRLDLEPDAEAGFRRPDGDHVRARVAGDHSRRFLSALLPPLPNRGGRMLNARGAQTRTKRPARRRSQQEEESQSKHRKLIERCGDRVGELQEPDPRERVGMPFGIVVPVL